jgi:hypothetical protein
MVHIEIEERRNMPSQQQQVKRPRKISRSEFDQLFPNRPLLEAYTGELVEWFANETNSVLGAIDHERSGTWSYVVMKKERDGQLRVVDINENMVSRSTAESELFQKMAAAEMASAQK